MDENSPEGYLMIRLGAFNYPRPSAIVVDNFYQDPMAIRELALRQTYAEDLRYYKGKRSTRNHLFPHVKETFERLIGWTIPHWQQYALNGIFQYLHATDRRVYHADGQDYAAAIYLTPDAPLEAGTSLHQSKATGVYAATSDPELERLTFRDKVEDATAWLTTDTFANRFNRLVLWNAKLIHSGGPYFGPDDITKCRLFQLFFFDLGVPLHEHFAAEVPRGANL